ncbi:MAG TPA: hypothetical protein VM910_37690 [Bradyrhizobium sp.]|nr:hypothetical protein [Bradyrhizobium sp.]
MAQFKIAERKRRSRVAACAQTLPTPPPFPTFPSGSLLAMTIPEFARLHGMSVAMFFKMQSQGEGPEMMAIGRRRMVSMESAARWRAAREKAATEAAE